MLTFIGIALRPSRNEDADSSQKPLTPERLFFVSRREAGERHGEIVVSCARSN